MTKLQTGPTTPSPTGRAPGTYTVTPLRTLVRRRIAWSFGRHQGPPSKTGCLLPGPPSLRPSDPSVHEEF
ncbi:hypothetical protein J7E96_08425 [Streptomyces sp. ISL-96]|uniref:hypothetical protein n=1 Tax=Streptomyces sp. ISL-96 TaxID=2819191 RepID=UPI001BE95B9D|nr:hypothetical protein [Streptomyces sp. ISL-96]MBT2488547.1 hypothetical protein [Streptomyces sp. ISL-96]